MKINFKIIILSFFVFSNISFAQTSYFKINGGKPVNEKVYTEIKRNYEKNGKIEELILKTTKTKDSIINYIKITEIGKTPDGNYFDPYSDTKKYIGTKFQIEKFKNEKSKNYSKNYLKGKPTFINFWFTKCPPCVEEIPLLNKLEEKYRDKVNFITITFNDKKTVNEFLIKSKFNFKHITNSKQEIENLKIEAYPTSLILDKNGTVRFVYGEITYDIDDINTILDGLLL